MNTFSTLIPLYNNNNPNIRHFIHLENGKKKELKPHNNNIYYYCIDRKKYFVEITGSLYHKKFKQLKENP